MKRIISIVLALVVVFICCSGIAMAAESSSMRASLVLISYTAGLTSGDNPREICIDYNIKSNGSASSIGVESIEIYRENGSYVTTITGTTSNGLIRTNSSIHKGTYDYTLSSGVSYYAEVTVFAKVGTEYDSRTITTSTVTAP